MSDFDTFVKLVGGYDRAKRLYAKFSSVFPDQAWSNWDHADGDSVKENTIAYYLS
jgi:hypothetical protein